MPDEEPVLSLETALARTEQDARDVLKVAEKVLGTIRAMHKAARVGDMRRLHAAPEAIRASVAALDAEVTRLAGSWDFDEESYLRTGRYLQEVLTMAKERGLRISLQDDRLYCSPVLVSLAPGDGAVKIEKKLERTIRPSALVELLRRRQTQQSRFKLGPFLEALHTTYTIAVQRQPATRRSGSVVPLRELYDLLTLFPGLSRDYSLPEFTRDIYVLDTEGEPRTRDGATVEFHASTGTKTDRGVLSLITDTGAEKRYYGIAFNEAHP